MNFSLNALKSDIRILSCFLFHMKMLNVAKLSRILERATFYKRRPILMPPRRLHAALGFTQIVPLHWQMPCSPSAPMLQNGKTPYGETSMENMYVENTFWTDNIHSTICAESNSIAKVDQL